MAGCTLALGSATMLPSEHPFILTKAHLLALRLTEELQLGQRKVERDLGVGEVAVVEGGAMRLVLLDGLVRVRVGVMLGIGLGARLGSGWGQVGVRLGSGWGQVGVR